MASTDSPNKQDAPAMPMNSNSNIGDEETKTKPDAADEKDQKDTVPQSDSQGARPKETPKTNAGEEAGASEQEILPVSDSCLDNLSKGLLAALLPHFQKHEESLGELTRNQVLLIETLQQENRKFDENTTVSELTQMMAKARRYQTKLTAIKKEMTSLHEKSTKLKKRALKLQQQKMKENLEREQQREKEIEEDRKLAAKRPSSTAPTKTAPHR